MRCYLKLFCCLLLLSLPVSAATIKGPTEVTPGMPVVFTMEGIPPEHLDKFNWQVFNAPADAMVLDLADRSGNPVLMFWSKTSATCAVIADVNVPPDQFELLVHEFSVGPPEPGPDPGPDPSPTTEVICLLLYESDDVDDFPWLGNVTTSQKIRRLGSDTLTILFADKNEKDERGKISTATKPWIDYAERHNLKLPRLFFSNERGELIATSAVPQTVDEVVKLIRGYAP